MKLRDILSESFSTNKADDKIINECFDILFEEAYRRTLNEGFPKSFLGLDNWAKNSISRIYRVGPKSKETEIKPELGTKKPYRDQLVVWVDESGDTIGYGVGADVRQTYSHGRWRRQDLSRKQMQNMAAKAYVISQDDTVKPKVKTRAERDMDAEMMKNNPFQKRAKAFLDKKRGKLLTQAKPEITNLKKAYNEYIDSLLDDIESGDVYDKSDMFNVKNSWKKSNKKLKSSTESSLDKLAKIGHIFWQMKSWLSQIKNANELQNLVAKVKSVGV